MKSRIVIPMVILALLGVATATFAASNQATEEASSSASANAKATAIAVMPELKYEFEPVVDGAEVVHDFTIKNAGEATLAIHQVKTG